MCSYEGRRERPSLSLSLATETVYTKCSLFMTFQLTLLFTRTTFHSDTLIRHQNNTQFHGHPTYAISCLFSFTLYPRLNHFHLLRLRHYYHSFVKRYACATYEVKLQLNAPEFYFPPPNISYI